MGTHTDFTKPFHHFQNFLKRRGIVAVISDFYEQPEIIIKTVEPLRYHGNEVVLFHVLDPQEIDPKFRDPVVLIDLEDKTSMEVSPEYARTEYRQRIDAHIAGLRDKTRAAGHGLSTHEHGTSAGRRLARVSDHPAGEDVMGFIAPWFLAGLAAVGLPIYFHLLKRHKTTPLPFASLMFFERRTQSSIKHRRLQYLLLFALRLAFIILLVLAFARPFIPSSTVASAHGSRTLALCIDDSFSMKQGGRLEQARQDALKVIAGMGAGGSRAGAGVRRPHAGPDRHDQRQGSAEGGGYRYSPDRHGKFLRGSGARVAVDQRSRQGCRWKRICLPMCSSRPCRRRSPT